MNDIRTLIAHNAVVVACLRSRTSTVYTMHWEHSLLNNNEAQAELAPATQKTYSECMITDPFHFHYYYARLLLLPTSLTRSKHTYLASVSNTQLSLGPRILVSLSGLRQGSG